jgi:hypothetical protein
MRTTTNVIHNCYTCKCMVYKKKKIRVLKAYESPKMGKYEAQGSYL